MGCDWVYSLFSAYASALKGKRRIALLSSLADLNILPKRWCTAHMLCISKHLRTWKATWWSDALVILLESLEFCIGVLIDYRGKNRKKKKKKLRAYKTWIQFFKKGKQHCLSIRRILSRRQGIKRKSALIILIALFSCFAGNSSSSPTHYCHHSANRMTCQIPALDYVCHQTVCWLTETTASICTFDTMTAFFIPGFP